MTEHKVRVEFVGGPKHGKSKLVSVENRGTVFDDLHNTRWVYKRNGTTARLVASGPVSELPGTKIVELTGWKV